MNTQTFQSCSLGTLRAKKAKLVDEINKNNDVMCRGVTSFCGLWSSQIALLKNVEDVETEIAKREAQVQQKPKK